MIFWAIAVATRHLLARSLASSLSYHTSNSFILKVHNNQTQETSRDNTNLQTIQCGRKQPLISILIILISRHEFWTAVPTDRARPPAQTTPRLQIPVSSLTRSLERKKGFVDAGAQKTKIRSNNEINVRGCLWSNSRFKNYEKNAIECKCEREQHLLDTSLPQATNTPWRNRDIATLSSYRMRPILENSKRHQHVKLYFYIFTKF